MASKKQLANFHARSYVQAVFEQRLREEGFTCPDDRLLCWYRVKNKEIVNSIVFWSPWATMPLRLEVGYGIHPLFIKPAYTASVSYSNRPHEAERFREQHLVENCPLENMRYMPFESEIQVIAPGHEGRGIYTFEGILLPRMDSVKTIEDCYQLHKCQRLSWKYEDKAIKFATVADTFIDEAIFLEDTEVYPYCMTSVEKHIAAYKKQCELKPEKKEYRLGLMAWMQRREALCDGSRVEYLRILESNKAQNIDYLKRKLGIIV